METVIGIVAAVIVALIVKKLLDGANANIAVAKHIEDEKKFTQILEDSAQEVLSRRVKLDKLFADEDKLYKEWKAGLALESEFLKANRERCDFQNFKKRLG